MRFFSLIRLTWMIFWRMLVFAAITGIISNHVVGVFVYVAPWIISGILIFGYGHTIASFPLWKLFRGNNFGIVFPYIDGRKIPKAKDGWKDLATVPSATNNGRRTGFEPKALEGVAVYRSSYMFGTPGSGLNGATGAFGATAVSLGMQGEQNFARALAKTGLLDRVATAFSVSVPEKGRLIPGRYNTDIDVLLATNDTLWLVDLKHYKSGAVTYRSRGTSLYCFDDATGAFVGESKKMSNNMKMADEAMRSNFPGMKVRSVVVFMPSDKGEGTLENVAWPGGISAMNLRDFLATIEAELRGGSISPASKPLGAVQASASALLR